MKNKKQTCNQCQDDMMASVVDDTLSVNFCARPECPSYALLQVGQEEMMRIADLLEEIKSQTKPLNHNKKTL